MAVNNNFINSVPSLVQPLATVFRPPIVAKRAPTANDINYPLGQEWVNTSTNSVFFLTSVLAGAANWQDVTGGAGVFTALTVNPGPTNLSTVGNGAVNIGNATNTGQITISSGTGNVDVLGNGNGIFIGTDAHANNVQLGSLTNGALTTIAAGNGTGVGTAAIVIAPEAAGDIQIGSPTHTGTIYLGTSTAGETINIGNAAGADTINIGHATVGNITNLASPITSLPGPVYIYTGAGAPSNALALHVGDLYINTTAASATTRMYIATAASTWTNVTCAA